MILRLLPVVGLLSFWVLLPACSPVKPEVATPAPVIQPKAKPKAQPKAVGVSFTKSVKPLLSNRCTICHNTQVLPKRPNFETREGAMQSGVIVPGNPKASRILMVIQEEPGADKAMPPVSHELTKDEVAMLERWIAEGAPWPAGEAGRVKPAFIPLE